MARKVLVDCGFECIRDEVKFTACGVLVNFEAVDQKGETWLFDVSGAFTVTKRPGLRRTDTLWKALGKATVLHSFVQRQPYPAAEADRRGRRGEPGKSDAPERSRTASPPRLVLLTTDKPARNSAGCRALREVTGPGKPIHDVIKMSDPDDMQRLREFALSRP